MRITCYSRGKFYLVGCPEGSRVEGDTLFVPVDGEDVAIPADPPELLPLLADAGRCGLMLVGERPELRLEGVECPACGEEDVSWLALDGDLVTCERCGRVFEPVSGPGPRTLDGPASRGTYRGPRAAPSGP